MLRSRPSTVATIVGGFVRGQGCERPVAVGQRSRRQRGLVGENIRASIQTDRHDAEGEAHALTRTHPHTVQGTHPGGQRLRGVRPRPRRKKDPRRSQGACAGQRIRADAQRAAQVVAAPARQWERKSRRTRGTRAQPRSGSRPRPRPRRSNLRQPHRRSPPGRHRESSGEPRPPSRRRAGCARCAGPGARCARPPTSTRPATKCCVARPMRP